MEIVPYNILVQLGNMKGKNETSDEIKENPEVVDPMSSFHLPKVSTRKRGPWGNQTDNRNHQILPFLLYSLCLSKYEDDDDEGNGG